MLLSYFKGDTLAFCYVSLVQKVIDPAMGPILSEDGYTVAGLKLLTLNVRGDFTRAPIRCVARHTHPLGSGRLARLVYKTRVTQAGYPNV